ncbi:MAG: hypothetical protein FWH19_00980 [Treponema sp.]|nr:hypothetical protein [Treponema sp.]
MEEKKDTVFYYSKERRQERAERTDIPIAKTVRFGPFKTTVGGRANLMLFFSIIIVVIILGISGRLFVPKRGFTLGGNNLTMNIVREEGLLALSLVKTAPRSGEVYLGEVNISVSAEGLEPFPSRIFFNPVDLETYRIILPFSADDADSFFVSFTTAFEQRSARLNVSR